MRKMQWTQEELQNLNANTYLICNYCGCLITNPRPKAIRKITRKQKRRRSEKEIITGDVYCDNCGKTYEETNSQIQTVIQGEKKNERAKR